MSLVGIALKILKSGLVSKTSINALIKKGVNVGPIQRANDILSTVHKLPEKAINAFLEASGISKALMPRIQKELEARIPNLVKDIVRDIELTDKARDRFRRVMDQYNQIVDEEAFLKYVRGEDLDTVKRIIPEMKTSREDLLKEIRKIQLRKRNVGIGYKNKSFDGYIETMRQFGYNDLADYIDELKNARGKLGQLVNERFRTGELQELLKEKYDPNKKVWVIDDEEELLEQLRGMFDTKNIEDNWTLFNNQRRAVSRLEDWQREQVRSRVEVLTPQEYIRRKRAREARRMTRRNRDRGM